MQLNFSEIVLVKTLILKKFLTKKADEDPLVFIPVNLYTFSGEKRIFLYYPSGVFSITISFPAVNKLLMIHIATVHFQTDRWIDIQLKYLHKNIKSDFRVYACVPEPLEKYENRYYFTSGYEPDTPSAPNVNHSKKLNYLAKIILEESADDDHLLFIDGDAFPIADISPLLERIPGQFPLAAVRRDENLGDRQPHPSFCATTTGFWKDIQGDWSPGFSWKNNLGKEITDAGGNLLESLMKRGISWYPMLRSNIVNPHRLWFAIYGGLIYHHGAGFRPATCRIDDLTYTGDNGQYEGSPQYFENLKIIERVYHNIEANEKFYLEFLQDAPHND